MESKQPCEPLILQRAEDDTSTPALHQYAARYLLDHQVEGVQWLWNHYMNKTGCILGDEMGLGTFAFSIRHPSAFSSLFSKLNQLFVYLSLFLLDVCFYL